MLAQELEKENTVAAEPFQAGIARKFLVRLLDVLLLTQEVDIM